MGTDQSLRKKETMDFLTEIRQNLQISQKQLAAYLGVSRELINLGEKGLRSLPHSAWEQLRNLSLNNLSRKDFQITDASLQAKLQEEKDRELKKLADREKLCLLHSAVLQIKLNKMRLRYEKTTQWYLAIQHRLAEITAIPENEETLAQRRQRLLLEIELSDAEETLLETSPTEQAKLRAQIFLLNAEAEVNRRIVEGRMEE